MDIEERIAKIRAAHETHAPTGPQSAPAEKKAFVVKVKREVAPEEAPASEIVFDIANNNVAKIMDRSDLSDGGLAEPPMLDWFHIGMRLQHPKQTASVLSTYSAERMAAKALIVAETKRLHWRIWNGKAQNAQKSIDRIRTVMQPFWGEPGGKKSVAPSRKLWTALQALDGYLRGQSHWLVNYAGLIAITSCR